MKSPTLAQLIRRSPALDAAARQRWLAVLPHLTDEDRARLREILTSGDLTPQPPSPARRGGSRKRASVAVSVLAEALGRWQHAAGPFWPYVCAAPFLGRRRRSSSWHKRVSERRPARDRPTWRETRSQTALLDKLLGAVDEFPLSLARGRGLGGGGSPELTGVASPGDRLVIPPSQ